MENLGYYNGTIDSLNKLCVPILDRAVYYGDGIYDATYTRNHIPFALSEHLQRFYEGCARIGIDLPMSKRQLAHTINECIAKVDDDELFVYWQASRGTAIRQHQMSSNNPNICIMIYPKKIKDISTKLKLISQEDKRYELCNIKTMNLLPNVLAMNKAIKWGCDECVFHRQGRVTECSQSNICMLKAGNLIVPPADRYILDGVARRHLIAVCNSMGYNVFERPFSLTQLMEADEVIVTSSGSLCLQVESIDSIKVGGKDSDMLSRLQSRLLAEFLDYTNIAEK